MVAQRGQCRSKKSFTFLTVVLDTRGAHAIKDHRGKQCRAGGQRPVRGHLSQSLFGVSVGKAWQGSRKLSAGSYE